MSCRHLHYHTPAPNWWHRLWCAECRAARSTDATLALGVECMKAQPFPDDGMKRTLNALELPYFPAHSQRRSSFARQRLRRFAGAFAILFMLALSGRIYYVNIPAQISVPDPVMPPANAFFTFRDAGMTIQSSEQIRKVNSDSQDVAGKTYPNEAEAENARQALIGQKFELVKSNRKALDTVRQGLNLPYQEPPARSFHASFPHYATFRSLAYLLSYEANMRAYMGEWYASAQSGLDAVQMGSQIPKGAPLIGRLTGQNCQSIGRQPVWEAVKHLDAQEARDAADRLKRIIMQHVPFGETLLEEKWAGLGSLKNDVLKPGWRRSFSSSELFPNPEQPSGNDALFTNVAWYFYLLRFSNQQIVDNYARYMDEVINTANTSMLALDRITLPQDPICAILLPTFSQANTRDMLNSTQNMMLYTTLLLHAHRLENGEYPESLDHLYQGKTRMFLGDPFRIDTRFAQALSTSLQLTYRRMGDSYLLYSYGPDGKDNGGIPIYDARRKNVEQYSIGSDSQGDIVVGTNLP